jgi:hypothetical protein
MTRFTPEQDRAMLARAHDAIDARDRRRRTLQRGAVASVAVLALGAALVAWWPARDSAPRDTTARDTTTRDTTAPAPPPPRFTPTDFASLGIVVERSPRVDPAHATRPPWVEIIESPGDLEAAFAEAGRCVRVVEVDRRIVTLACGADSSDSEP